MTTPINPTNPLESTIDTGVAAGADAAKTAVDTAAETSQAWLKFPIVKQLFESLVGWILGLVSQTGQLVITFVINRVQGNIENSDLVAAEKAYISAVQGGNSSAIESTRAALIAAQSASANSGGTAQPK